MISVIIPSRNERYLSTTIADIMNKFTGEYEIIVVLDTPSEYPLPPCDDRLSYVYKYNYDKYRAPGIRDAINLGVLFSHGEYILKVDAHCGFDQDFDRILLQHCLVDEVMVARRYTLDIETWQPRPRFVDYYYLSCPWTYPRGTMMMQSCPWITRTELMWQDSSVVDDLMCFQGSMWMMSRDHWDWLGGLEIGEEVYAEHHEISMKTWLGGRRVVINKDTSYYHPRERVSGYHMSMGQVYKDHDHSARYWTTNQWAYREHDFDWLIEKFWPLPTKHNRHRLEKYYWPENWWDLYL